MSPNSSELKAKANGSEFNSALAYLRVRVDRRQPQAPQPSFQILASYSSTTLARPHSVRQQRGTGDSSCPPHPSSPLAQYRAKAAHLVPTQTRPYQTRPAQPKPPTEPNTNAAEVWSSRRQGPAQERPDGPRRRSARTTWPRSGHGPRRPRAADADGRTRQGRPRSATGKKGEGDAAPDEERPRTRPRAGPGDAAAQQ